MRTVSVLLAALAAASSSLWSSPLVPQQKGSATPRVAMTEVAAGVKKWSAVSTIPRFFDLLQNRINVPVTVQPFGRSVGLLAGVSSYTHLKQQLPGVAADLERVRIYLLEAGFDEVWTVEEQAVTQERLASFLQNQATLGVTVKDRVLFYYAGHGIAMDRDNTVGFVQLTGALPNRYDDNVIAMSMFPTWLRTIGVRHTLFVLDTCAAGLSLPERSGESVPATSIMNTLSSGGSRIIMTAGTGPERTGEIKAPDGRMAGAFTAAWLDASRSVSGAGSFVTSEQVFAQLKRTLASLLLSNNREPTVPQYVPLDPLHYKGEFLFLAPATATTARLQPDEARLLGVASAPTTVALPAPLPTSWKELSFRLGRFVERAARLAVDLGVTGHGQIIDLPLLVQNESGSARVLRLEQRSQAIVASWEGGGWTTVAEPNSTKALNVRIHVDDLRPSDALELVGKGAAGEEATVASISFPVTEKRELQIARETSSSPTASGIFSAFSGPHRLCLGAAPAGYALVPDSARYWLTGDRQCGAWATCDWEQRSDQNVCFNFRLQGHSEDPFDAVRPRTSTGHIRAQYRLKWGDPRLRAIK